MDDSPDVQRLTRRLEREHRARIEAEAIAEESTRALYDRQRDLALLESIAVASNEASSIESALQHALDAICAFTGWPVGHAYLLGPKLDDTLYSSPHWHLSDPERFATFRAITESTSLRRGVGLPGRVLASGKPAWIMDVNEDANFPRARHAAEIGVKAGFGFPVLAGKDIVGVLEFYSIEALEPNARLLEIMVHVGTQLGRVIERKNAEDQVRHMAYHDALTGLPNRWLLEDRFEVALAQARRDGTQLALASLDLDRFKLINDSLGHVVGDALLKATAQRLASVIRKGDSLARFGGDEFVLLLPGVGRPEDGAKIAEAITAAFKEPFQIAGQELRVTMSVGISLYPNDGDDSDQLIKNADTAMYRAKECGRNNYQLYRPEMTAEAGARLQLEGDLRRGLEREEFVVFYQPVVDATDERIVGVEALVRWRHPERGLVSPLDFIPVAEDTGLIVPLGEWVLRTACTQVHAWRVSGVPELRLAVNISVAQFARHDFVQMLERVLRETSFDPLWLELEVTESIAMRDAEATIGTLQTIREMGIRTSVDDFGTGYSSLKYLKDLPVHTLKIDQSFIQDLATNAGNATITRNIISLAHSLNLRVIAEGVETDEQAQFLRQRQCDELQGFLWAKPMSAGDFEALIACGGMEGHAPRFEAA